jgi:hypothetical protein
VPLTIIEFVDNIDAKVIKDIQTSKVTIEDPEKGVALMTKDIIEFKTYQKKLQLIDSLQFIHK